MKPSFWFLWSSDEVNQPLDVLFIRKLGHIIEEDLQQELGNISSFMFFSIYRLGHQLGDKTGIFFEQFSGIETLFFFSLVVDGGLTTAFECLFGIHFDNIILLFRINIHLTKCPKIIFCSLSLLISLAL